MRKYLLYFACALFFVPVSAQKNESVLYEQTSEVNNLMVTYNADNSSLARVYFIKNSPERRERFKKLNEDYLAQLAKLNFDKLPVGSRVDYILFKRNLQQELRTLEIEEIQRYVFRFLSESPRPQNRSLANLATTCRTFLHPALEALWFELLSLDRLVMCLPEDSWEFRKIPPGDKGKPTLVHFSFLVKNSD